MSLIHRPPLVPALSPTILLACPLVILLAAPSARALPALDDGAAPAPDDDARTARDAPPPPEAPAPPRPKPRVELGYRSFAIANLDATRVPLGALELDLYPLSTRWLRGGFSAAAGKGHGAMDGQDVSLRYGLLGVTAGLQYPARITPFVQGGAAAGILAGAADGAITVPGTSVSIAGASAATLMWDRGVDVGADLYTVGRLFLSVSVGWLRTSWRGPDLAAMAAAPAAGLRLKDVQTDSMSVKVGVGL
jgi:hypothetical protein